MRYAPVSGGWRATVRITRSKIAATFIGLGYVVLAMVKTEWASYLLNPWCPFMALALIWLAEWLAEFTGFLGSKMVYISRKSPGIVFTILGWFMLLTAPGFMAMCDLDL